MKFNSEKINNKSMIMNGIGKLFLFLCLIYLSGCYTIPVEKQRILARETNVLFVHYSDYKQTMNIVRNPKEFHEENKILGPHPSKQRVNSYFIIFGILHAGITYILPENVSKIIQSIELYDRVNTVAHNKEIGLKSEENFEFYISHEWKF